MKSAGAHPSKALTAVQVRAAREPGRYADGGGLYLIVDPSGAKRWLLRTFLKNIVTGDKPYSKNSRTAPEFIIVGQKDFEQEKARLIGFITKTQQLGADHFEGKENFSFGPMTAQEWNGLFYKHLDHHLMQFGV